MRSSATSHSAANRAALALALSVASSGAIAAGVARAPDAPPMSQYIVERFGPERGFPSGQVYAIAQSGDGYLWVGTDRGLLRFDGQTFTPVRQRELGLDDTSVLGLTSDGAGNLLVRLRGPTVLQYASGRFDAVEIAPAPAPGIVTAWTRGTDGRVLLSSLGSGMRTYRNRRVDAAIPRASMPSSIVMSVAEGPDGAIWMGTRDAGLYRYQDHALAEIGDGLPDRKVNAVVTGSDDDVWVGTDSGVVRWDGARLTTAGVPAALVHAPAVAMLLDSRRDLWVSTPTLGVVRVNASGAMPLDPSMRAGERPDATALFEDRERNLWIGSARGLQRVRLGAFRTYSTPDGLPTDSGGAVHRGRDGRTWFAPADGGLFALEGSTIARVAAREIGGDVVYALDGVEGELWAGRQRGGLTRLRFASGRVEADTFTTRQGLAQDSVFAVHRDRHGVVWAGTLSGGLSRFEDGRFRTYTTADGLASNSITSIVEASDGSLWIGTSSGVSVLAGTAWQTYRTGDGLPSETVNCVYEDSGRTLWIGTAAGLAVVEGGRIEAIPLPAALRAPVLGIAEDGQGSLWLAVPTGVVRVDRARLASGRATDADLRELGAADGLRGIELLRRSRVLVAGDGGRIWLAASRGFPVIDPAVSAGGDVEAIARIQQVTADGAALVPGSDVRVPAGSRRLTFSYAGLSLSAPERVRFRYRLDGFDADWSAPVSAREAVYTNLGPGTYAFRVRASNSDGAWNGSDEVLPFTIPPRIWQRTSFRAAVVLIVAAAGIAWYRFRVRSLARQLSVRFEERLAERTRIAQELHDTLLQGFVSASMQLHVAADRVPADSPARQPIARVLDLMSRVIDEGRNAVRGLRTTTGAAADLEERFCAIPNELGEPHGATYRVIVEGRPRPLHAFIGDDVLRIGREAVVNAFRHANATAIEVELEYSAAQMRVIVRDNGRGIDERVLESGRDGHWGLPGMRERAERIGARLRVWTRAGAGTEIVLAVPADVAFTSAVKGGGAGD